jgi:alpha-tubulin suppressor-like RCC1 family protein
MGSCLRCTKNKSKPNEVLKPRHQSSDSTGKPNVTLEDAKRETPEPKPQEVSPEDIKLELKAPDIPEPDSPEIIPEPSVPCFSCPSSLPELNFYDFDSGLKSGEFERSRPMDWQNILKSTFDFNYSNIFDAVAKLEDNPFIHSYWDKKLFVDLPSKLLSQPPVEWFKEQVFLLKRTMQPGNEMGKVSIRRKIIQLLELFKWLVWSVGCYLYISLSQNERAIGKTFTQLSEVKSEISLPRRLKEWLAGFRFKNVRFKLIDPLTDEGRVMRSEMKAIRLFTLNYGPAAGDFDYFIQFPMLVNMKIGPFVLFAVPIYPQSLLSDGRDLDLNVFSKPLRISETNVFKIQMENEENRGRKEITTCYLLYNFTSFIPESRKIQYLCVLSSAGKEIPVFEANFFEGIPKGVVQKLYNGEAYETEFQVFEGKMMGWNYLIFYEEHPVIQKKNERASLFGCEILGEAVVFLRLNKKNYKRPPVYNLSPKRLMAVLRKNLKDCMIILETSEDIVNVNSLKELLHRKGLNYRHEWILYSRCRNEKAQGLLEADLLARAVKKVLNHLAPSQFSFSAYVELAVKVLWPLISVETKKHDPLVRLALFLERLKSIRDGSKLRRKTDLSVSRIIEPFKEKKHSHQFLSSSEMLDKVISVACRIPGIFLEAFEFHSGLKISEEFLNLVKSDSYYFRVKGRSLEGKDFVGFDLQVRSISSTKEENCITLLGFLQRVGPQGNDSNDMLNGSFADWVSEANQDQVNDEEEHHCLELILPCDLYSYCNSQFFKETYEFPALTILEEWSNCVATLIKDLITVDGGEGVYAEILIYVITQKYFIDSDSVRCKGVLDSIGKIIDEAVFIPSEIVVAYYLWNAICTEQPNLALSEQHYITSLMLMTKLLGDPRGRKNRGIPWQMLAAWKISQIARDSHRLPDALAAEEHFDSVFMGTKEFQQNLIKLLKARNSASKQAEVILKHPFEHWSTLSSRRESLVPESLDEFGKWMINHSLTLFQSGRMWSNLYTKLLVKGTKLPQMSTSIFSMSGTSTPVSFRGESRRGLQQSSLTQILIPENGAMKMDDLIGVAYIWGTDKHGQLGLALADEEEVPDQVTLPHPRMLTSLKDYVIKEVSAGAEHCIAITIEGLCFAWGKNDNNQLGLGPDNPSNVKFPVMIKSVTHIVKASCGYEHTVLLGFDSRIYSMGLGEGGVLGHGNVLTVVYPKLIQALKSVKIKEICCGAYHSTALDKDGHLYVWGRGEGGQLGIDPEQLKKQMAELKIDSSEAFIHTPQRLFGELANKKFKQVACGEAHTLVLSYNKEVFVWGWGSNGQLGRGYKHDDFDDVGNKNCIQYLPVLVDFPQDVVISHIAAGGLFSMFITEKKEVLACGMNDFGQLGIDNPRRSHTDISTPTKLDCFEGFPINYLVCGENHTMAVSLENENMITWAWGRFREGQLGVGDVSPSANPRIVTTLNNSPVYRVGCGRKHTIAVIGEPRLVDEFEKKEKLDLAVTLMKEVLE